MTDCIIPFPGRLADKAAADRESYLRQVAGVCNCLRSLTQELRDLGLDVVVPMLEVVVQAIEALVAIRSEGSDP